MKLDYHIHSEYSYDCKTPINEIVEVAHSKGFDDIIITDHYEVHSTEFLKPFVINDLEKYFKECKSYGLQVGVEFGWDCESPINISLKEFDFILLSVHKFENNNGKINFASYLNDVLKTVTLLDDYHMLAHLDFPRRYTPDKACIPKEHYPVLREIFKTIISKDKGIEVNTKPAEYYGLPDQDYDILKLYKELGGEKLTIGSDSHFTKYIGSNIEKTLDKLKNIGFKYIQVFENGSLVFKKI